MRLSYLTVLIVSDLGFSLRLVVLLREYDYELLRIVRFYFLYIGISADSLQAAAARVLRQTLLAVGDTHQAAVVGGAEQHILRRAAIFRAFGRPFQVVSSNS